ncbi:MAG: alpha/beta hydrolase fold domain-containing protein [Firmicutes bacterium]|nr:alpha/beta hydrolase fold domain-containing protein [Candidatus Colimorpha enterica]
MLTVSFTYRKKTETITCKGRSIPLLIISPTDKIENRSGVLWIHGGGYVTGMKEMALFSRAMYFVKRGCTVVSPDYTLAGKAPYPAALEDCYAALMWMRKNAPDLGFSPDRIIVGGESAGGGLCAALCMYARDRKEVNVCYQFPLYPMLDCNDTPSSRNNHGKIWNTKRNRNAWKKYLSGLTEVTPYASPSRQTDYSFLPPMYSFVGTGEPFFCETIQYMKDLRRAGVKAEVDIYDTDFHSFDLLKPLEMLSKEATKKFEAKADEAMLCSAPNPPLEIERKFLIFYPDVEKLTSVPGAEKLDVSQTYLVNRGNGSERIRKTVTSGGTVYTHTIKKRISAEKRIEDEETVSPEEYEDLKVLADPGRHEIVKTRYRIPCGDHIAEIDVYPFWNDRATAEVELLYSGEDFTLPDCVTVIRDVTDDPRYLNSSLAVSLGAFEL